MRNPARQSPTDQPLCLVEQVIVDQGAPIQPVFPVAGLGPAIYAFFRFRRSAWRRRVAGASPATRGITGCALLCRTAVWLQRNRTPSHRRPIGRGQMACQAGPGLERLVVESTLVPLISQMSTS